MNIAIKIYPFLPSCKGMLQESVLGIKFVIKMVFQTCFLVEILFFYFVNTYSHNIFIFFFIKKCLPVPYY